MVPSIPPVLRAATPDLPDVPPLVQYLLACFVEPILAWMTVRVLRLLLTRFHDHPLVQLALTYDPAPIVAVCADYYHQDGTKGAPPTFSIDLLVRAEIVRAFSCSCSDRELEWHLHSNLVVRWFVGLGLLAPAPDHATLSRFHAWVSTNHPDALFRDALAFLDRVDPEDAARTPQIVDTFALQTPAAPTPTVGHLLLALCCDLITAWRKYAPLHLQHALPPLDLGPICHPPRCTNALHRQELLVQSVALTQRLQADLSPHLAALPDAPRAHLSHLLAALAKVLADEVQFDANDYPTERSDKGHARIASATDREATFRLHNDDCTFGYNVALATSATRIRAVSVLTGCTPDSEAPAQLLEQQREADQPLPPYLVMDRAGGWGKTRAVVDSLSEGHTQMVAYVPQGGGSDPSRFSVADFRYDPHTQSCTCPAGVRTTKVYAHGSGEGVQCRFTAAQCKNCPLWEQCRQPDANPKGHRSVFISEYHPYLLKAHTFNGTAQGQALLGQRWQVEPTVAWLVRYQGCRRARRVGVEAAQCQLFWACGVRNLLLWLARRKR